MSEEIDWKKIWAEKFEERRQMMREGKDIDAEYWSKRAESYSDGQTTNNFEYGSKVVEVLHELITPEFEVLDIGAGPGTLLIPFAKKVKKVTAVEPAVGMIECLKRNAEQKGIENFEIMNSK
ncbi:MAG: class I SAM-dependent methyltransferase, partial [Nitrospirota bacterium]|nr:class I SAM-dependent methyltransferase [Nitrospirota bacterium]